MIEDFLLGKTIINDVKRVCHNGFLDSAVDMYVSEAIMLKHN